MFLPRPAPAVALRYPIQLPRWQSAETPTQENSSDQQQPEPGKYAQERKHRRRPRPTPSGAPPLCGRAQAGANRFSGLTDTRFYPILSKPRLPSGDSKRRVARVSEGGSKANRTSPPAYDNRRPCRRQADNQWRDARAGFRWPHLLGPGVSRELADSSGLWGGV